MEFALYMAGAALAGYVVGRMAGHWRRGHIEAPIWRQGMGPYMRPEDEAYIEADYEAPMSEAPKPHEALAQYATLSREAHDGPSGNVGHERTHEAPSREALIEALRARREG